MSACSTAKKKDLNVTERRAALRLATIPHFLTNLQRLSASAVVVGDRETQTNRQRERRREKREKKNQRERKREGQIMKGRKRETGTLNSLLSCCLSQDKRRAH